jgi:hypothetical protein
VKHSYRAIHKGLKGFFDKDNLIAIHKRMIFLEKKCQAIHEESKLKVFLQKSDLQKIQTTVCEKQFRTNQNLKGL